MSQETRYTGQLSDHCKLYILVPMTQYDRKAKDLPVVSVQEHALQLADYQEQPVVLEDSGLKTFYSAGSISEAVRGKFALAMLGSGRSVKEVRFNYELSFVDVNIHEDNLESVTAFDFTPPLSKALAQWVLPILHLWAEELYPEEAKAIDALNRLTPARISKTLFENYPKILNRLFARFPALKGVRHPARIELASGVCVTASVTTLRYEAERMKFLRTQADPETFIVLP